ncbi:hypothetical protein V1477_013667 [Vespula maculifrons]|uniref:Uncharacterized protein n=1 Tax=Vespula maculifrons TaxID=7453 RepID=A0ABD2BP84_VESMC
MHTSKDTLRSSSDFSFRPASNLFSRTQWFIQRARIERKKEEEEEEGEEEEGEEGEEEAKQEILWSGMQSPKAPW